MTNIPEINQFKQLETRQQNINLSFIFAMAWLALAIILHSVFGTQLFCYLIAKINYQLYYCVKYLNLIVFINLFAGTTLDALVVFF